MGADSVARHLAVFLDRTSFYPRRNASRTVLLHYVARHLAVFRERTSYSSAEIQLETRDETL